MGEWKTIDSAPKDGTRILAVNDRGMFVVEFDECWGDGWWMVDDGKNCDHPLRGSVPTHWQPLPPPPEPLA